ncbi:MAG: T9SS type A sorting domain-containing protein [Bacteroidetes bacterium]|nr:T9SS type A sorting domain-containing protein [Bacteroidota bacterium]
MFRVIVFILFCNVAFAQKNESRNAYWPIDELKATSYSFAANGFPVEETKISDFLSHNINHLPSLKLLYTKQSMGGMHYCYQQNINGVSVYRAQVKVNVLKNKKAVNVYALTFPSQGLSVDFPTSNLAQQFVLQQKHLSKYKIEKTYFFQHTKLIPAYLIYIEKTGALSYEYIMDESGAIVYSSDLLSYSGKKDSTAVFAVFNPDPITSAQTVYGAPYADDNDSDNPSLNNEIQHKTLSVKFENDTFFLENDFYKIEDIDQPNNTPAISKNDSFVFNRSEIGFEEVNSFYHINTFRTHVKSLGFNDIVDFQLSIDAHAHSGGDNSSFNEFSTPVSLLFGDGGVDDAEDADVVVHEFGHAISAAAAHFSNNGGERKAIDEGFGDYCAASYSRSNSNYHWEEIFNWDGHNEFWDGRTAVTNKHYPEDYSSTKWKDGQMWSATLMQIQDDIGANSTDSIVLQALYSQAQNTTMSDAARLLLDADTALFNGKYATVLYQRLSARGFLGAIDTTIYKPTKEIEIFIHHDLYKDGGLASIYLKTPADATIELFDLSGRLIDKTTYSNLSQTDYLAANISSGAYLLRVSTSLKTLTVKLVRY